MSTGTLAGLRVTNATVSIPAHGVWWADVSLDQEATLSGQVELVVADLTLMGAIVSGGSSVGRSHWRVTGGAGGWSQAVKAKGYANDAGVKLSSVLLDAAREVGETVDEMTIPATRVGPSYAREAGPASRVLQQLVPASWYVGEDGVTRIGARAATDIAVAYQAEPIDRAMGTLRFAAESIASVVPGIRVDGIQAVDVLHELKPKGLRSTIWGDGIASTSRRLNAERRIFEQLFPRMRYLGVYEFRVITVTGNRLTLQPTLASSRMPNLERVPVRPGVPGARGKPALGSRVLVAFVNADPGRPVVVGFEEADASGFEPDELFLVGEDDAAVSVAEAHGRVVRYGDPIVFPPSPGPGTVEIPVAASLSRVRA